MPASRLNALARRSFDSIRPGYDDPLTSALRPPPNETPEARAKRISDELDAQSRSKAIDEILAADRRALEKKKNTVKVLLLGQAESGKSTTLKNFQLTFAPAQFHAERSAWRAVVHLNLIASVRIIVNALQVEIASAPPSIESPSPYYAFAEWDSTRPGARSPSPSFSHAVHRLPSPVSYARSRSVATSPSYQRQSQFNEAQVEVEPTLTNEHRKLVLRLGALLQVEHQLARSISPDAVNCTYDPAKPPFDLSTSREIFVRAGHAWKDAMVMSNPDNVVREEEATAGAEAGNENNSSMFGRRRNSSQIYDFHGNETFKMARQNVRERESGIDDTTAVLAACCDDIVALWADPVVRMVLKNIKVDIENYPGFFLNDAARIAQLDYEPTIDDILRVRLETMGVEEHHLRMETLSDSRRQDWVIYDVGGHRGNRHKWIPYFEDIDAIIFLAPLVFTQTLQEDSSVNRVEDSILLWRKICANPLLSRATIVLFLNKIDLVARTLESGVRLRDYVPSYGDLPNEVSSAVKYFRSKFKAYQKALSPIPRFFYCHETSVIDSQATSTVLVAVREGIIMHHLQDAHVIL